MFTMIGNIVACVFWGLLIASILIFVLYILLKALYNPFRMSIAGTIATFILFILLFIQGTLMTGAFYAKGYADDMYTWTLEAIRSSGESADRGMTNEAEEIKRQVKLNFPPLSSYISGLNAEELKGGSTSVALALTKNIKSLINRYILQRVLWMAGIMTVGGILLGWTRKREGTIHRQSGCYSAPGKYTGMHPGGNRPGRSNGF